MLTVKTEQTITSPLIVKNRAIKILAKSIFRELESQGYDEKQVIALATELISEVTSKMAVDKRA